ncbi:hypothetical protein HG536_0C01940 [Torulaspora globosa]|uniref:Protein CSF1 n=1 Tax=Torulaspora globosa TaxID=48254 RepID=A0A7G3ZEU0_9SACH|nr:uncharacterized protein HG536_0C01940 [Torulaspora globosa]QLL32026.1 hypothetical protein HG536_0C01940 [Torulaspora globosa]
MFLDHTGQREKNLVNAIPKETPLTLSTPSAFFHGTVSNIASVPSPLDFIKVSLNAGNFSWVFLVDWALLCVVSLTVIFYLGRLFAYAITLILEWLLWRRWHVKVSVESVRIAPLSGSIVFKNLCIINRDYTVSILKGSIAWRYWEFTTRRSQYEILQRESPEDGEEADVNSVKNLKLPCRFLLSCEGFEMFMYNRTVAYDNIIRLFSKDEKVQFEKFLDDQQISQLSSTDSEGNGDKDLSESLASSETSNATGTNDRVFDEIFGKQKSLFMRLLPLDVELHKGSFVLGNKFTPSLLVASYSKAQGVVDLCLPREKLDLYGMKFQVDYRDVDVSIKQNIAYERKKSTFKSGKLPKLWRRFLQTVYNPLLKRWHSHRMQHDDHFLQRWKGLSLYKGRTRDKDQEDLDNLHYDFASHEYARVSSVLKSARTVVTYEYDIPGIVPHGAHATLDGPDVGNSGAPPEYALDFQLHGATLCYGPWAHRQIQHLQKLLSPIVAKSSKPVKTLSPGSRRIYTVFKTTFTVLEDSSWRIPTRERSKDQEFLKHYRETREDYRPFGWLDLKFANGSLGSVTTTLCPTEEGFPNKMTIHFVDLEAISSVNHDRLLKCQVFDVLGDLGYPLGWNSDTTWAIELTSAQLETFLLREHITLIADVFSDFSSGEPTPYELFRPFVYDIRWAIKGYSLYLNVNDHNIVNNPLDFNENCYLSLHGEDLSIDVTVPNNSITGTITEVSYQISTSMFRLQLNTPPWNTLNEFMANKEVGRSYDFTVRGVYIFFSELDIENVDTVSVECSSMGTTLHCYGFVMRYLMNVKMNYFGDFFNFITSEEYTGVIQAKETQNLAELQQESLRDGDGSTFNTTETKGQAQNVRNNPPFKRSAVKRNTNETDIWFVFSVWEGALVLPETLYNCDPCIVLHFGELTVDLRSCNYYMDLLATMNNTSIKRYVSRQPHEIFELIHKNNGRFEQEHGSLSTLTIHGHRMYGLPPKEPTYFCQWGIDIDNLVIRSDAEFAKGFFTLFSGIAFGYSNLENTLLYDVEAPDDMTSVTVRARNLNFVIDDEHSKIQATVIVPSVTFTAIDFENERYSQRIDLKIPKLNISLGTSGKSDETESLFELTSKLCFTTFIQRRDFAEHRDKQRSYIALNDSPFYRCSFLLPCYIQQSPLYTELLGSISPSSSLPPLPLPLLPETIDFIIEDLLGEFAAGLKCDSDTQDSLGHSEALGSSSSSPLHGSERSAQEFYDHKGLVPMHSSFDPSNRYENIVLNIEFLAIEANPSLCSHIVKFFDKFWQVGTVDVIDEIEMSIVRRLGHLNSRDSICNSKVYVGDINFFWGSKDAKGFELYFDKFDFEMSQEGEDMHNEYIGGGLFILSKLRSLRATVFDRGFTEGVEERPPALSLAIEGWEAFSSKTDSVFCSISSLSTDVTVDESQLEWLVLYVSEQYRTIRAMLTSFQEMHNYWKSVRKDLLCSITAASEFYQISHDPYVITKPAFIMRLSNGHVRENRSWRIITRLRHILTYLPADWLDNSQFQKVQQQSASSAEDVFVSVFSNWRSWEVSDVTRSYIYQKIFLSDDYLANPQFMKKALKVNFYSFFFTVYSEGYRVAHNFVITRANIGAEELFIIHDSTTQTITNYDKTINVSVSLGALKGELNEQLLKIFRVSHIDDTKGPNDNFLGTTSYRLNLLLAFERSELQFVLAKTRLTNRIINGKVTILLEKLKDSATAALSVAFYAKRSESWLKHADAVLAEVLSRELCTTATADLWCHSRSMIINTQCSDCHFRAMTSTALLVKSVDEILDSVMRIKQEFKQISPEVQDTKEQTARSMMDTAMTFSFTNITAEIMALSPFLLRFEMKQLAIYLNKLESNELLISMWDSSIHLKSHQTTEQYLNFALSDLQMKFNLPERSSAMLGIGLSSSLMKLTFSEPRRILSSFLQDEKLIGDSFSHMERLLSKYTIPANKSGNARSTKWSLDANLNYLGILIPMSSTFFVLELHMLLAAISNLAHAKVDKANPVLGQISVENCLLLIKDPLLPVGLSKLLDFSIRLTTSQKVQGSPNSYQVESSHFRVCLSPQSLVQVLWGAHQMQALLQYFRKHRKDSISLPFFANGHKPPVELPIAFRSIHILSYNLCIGWIFQLGDDTESGLMLGFDRLFSAYEKNCGKLTLIDGYLSVANGDSTDTFYSRGNEKSSYNRSFLPSVQVAFWLKQAGSMKDLFIRIKGEALDVSYLSTSVSIVEGTLASIQKFQTLKKERMHHGSEIARNRSDSNNAAYDVSPFLSHIRLIDCQFNYLGGIFKIYSPDDLTRNGEPSLEVKSPSVTITLNYKHDVPQDKPHWLRCLITIDPTHNILYSKCVPLLSDFIETTRSLIEKLGADESRKEYNQGIDYMGLLDTFDIAFKVRSGKQQLSLSCDPRAKVQADVGFDSFNFGVITNDVLENRSLGVSLSIEKIRSSVRHIFSRETSASFDIDFFDLTSIFAHPNIYAVALVSDIKVFFNMKQLQNLNLFLDIWRLNGKLSAGAQHKDSEGGRQVKNPSATQRKKASPISFSVTLIFNTIKGDINLGPSLGVLSLQLGRIWFATDHFAGHKHVLHAFADQLSIQSKGRFSGALKLEDAAWMSEVRWPMVEPLHETPEMSLSLTIARIAVKSAFDYHMFLIGTVDQVKFKLRNESDSYGILPDLLVVNLSCNEMNLCATALTAANILDIYNTITRMRRDNRISYTETLKESNTAEGRLPLRYDDILESLNLVRTDLSVDVASFKTQISPISLFDLEVLVLSIENVCARSETKSGTKLKTELHLQFSNASASLSTSKNELDEDAISKISVEDYMLYAAEIRGGTIVKIPRLLISMTTWQTPKSDIIEYLFTCRFFDRVAVKWNLGPVDFIKEMWSTYVRSLAVRRAQSSEHGQVGDEELQAASKPGMEEKPKFQYVPLDEPYIEMPQIKDLGDATPPIEWFGVHRKNLPAATHQAAIILIQKLVHAAEKEYAKVLE